MRTQDILKPLVFLFFAVLRAAAQREEPSVADRADLSIEFPSKSGVYLRSPNGWITLPYAGILIRTRDLAKSLNPFGGGVNRITFAGTEALLHISEPKPRFYVKTPKHRSIQIIRLEKTKEYREVRLAPKKGLRVEGSALREFEVSQVASGGFWVTPKTILPPGEYALVVGKSGSIGVCTGSLCGLTGA